MEQRLPEADVQMKNFSFQPSEIRVSPGREVTWINNDPTTHTVTAEDGSFDSGNLEQGEGFSFIFKEKGTFKYYCAIHPGMRGQVVVA
ncbi:MAG: cupredoxin family copper-binding protein [Actinobacteria bacterium]|nr:cupredoxin family copper-binding protein [Actinomycetota bacterium]